MKWFRIELATLVFGCAYRVISELYRSSSRILVVLAVTLVCITAHLPMNAHAQGSANAFVVPLNSTFRGLTYTQWSIAFWQWAMALPVTSRDLQGFPHPFNDCNNRPISADQTGSVWYWSAPDGTQICDQRATIIPAGKAIFLTIRDIEASSLDDPPFQSDTAAGQETIALFWSNHIIGVFCTIDGVPVNNVSAFRFLSPQFRFHAPTPWIFGSTGGNGTSVADGYYLMLQLLPGSHTIHYGGTFHFNAGEIGPDPVDFPKDVTLLLTIGPVGG